MAAEIASLTASLIDRAAARDRIEHALAATPIALSLKAATDDAPLFREKHRTKVSPLASVAPRRLWLRLSAAERRRINLTAAFFGQSTAAFLRDALTAFMDNFVPLAAARPAGARPLPGSSPERRVKLAFRVAASVHAAVHSAAVQRGESIQTLLATAIDMHLARLLDKPAAKNLRPLLEAFDAVTAERAAGPGAQIIDFPRRHRLVASPSSRHRAAP